MKNKRKILVTGASVAGPTLAFWLARQGMDVTVVERAPEFRDGGQTIDVRGAGKIVAQRMGLESAIRSKSTHEDGIKFVDEQDRTQAEIGIGAFGGNGPVAELEILRGELAKLLIEHGRSTVNYRFGDSIAALEELPHGVKVRFEQGGEQVFDLVIGAEGVGSHTRKLVFGNEVTRRSFDLYTAYFTIPRTPGDARQMRWFNAPGGLSVCLRPDNLGTTRRKAPACRAENPAEAEIWRPQMGDAAHPGGPGRRSRPVFRPDFPGKNGALVERPHCARGRRRLLRFAHQRHGDEPGHVRRLRAGGGTGTPRRSRAGICRV
ncbi:MAG: FAD-dependent monooxygenase [Janthinobacterium sp.]|nr:FAD-dependent monooxygenase [Janthinobacterium sp.]MCX7290208.1 FAD-dependent monooxygenase [Janthinobacterium sp.]